MQVTINGQKFKLSPSNAIGKGGESDVYCLPDGKTVAKIYKPANHPDLVGLPVEQQMAENRIREHQTKLKDFPTHLPPHVVAPVDLVYDGRNKILGYTMPFLSKGEVLYRYTERNFRQNIQNETINKIFLDLLGSVDGLHKKGMVIGDFNDLNIMVIGEDAFLIDADSMQFGKYACHVFTAKFLDPLLCEPDKMIIKQQHNEKSDWYAFNIMLFQSLLLVGPYGGIYKPLDKTKKIGPDKRPLHRITVFHPEVQYPKPANTPDILPDDLLEHFHRVFEKDDRGVFPKTLIENLDWTTCRDCNLVHAKHICPSCGQKPVGKVVQTIRIRGTVTATTVFKTAGDIVFAAVQNGKIHYLIHENGQFLREGLNGRDPIPVMPGQPDNRMRFRICGSSTIIAKGHQMVTLEHGQAPDKKNVDTLGWLSAIDANSTNRFWIENGVLYRDHKLGRVYGGEKIGDVLQGQTQFWVGDKFGFGYYRAGEYYGSFVFDTNSGGLNDSVKLPKIQGQIIDSTCVLSDNLAWFFVKSQTNGRTINRVFVVGSDGKFLGEAEASDGDGSWLGTIRGKCAMGNMLMAATDDGIVIVVMKNGQISVAKEFPDTEQFVDTGYHLFPIEKDVFVVSRNEITRLQIA